MIVKSYAKINLALEITSKDKNSYHNLNTMMCLLENYYDILHIKKASKFSVNVFGTSLFEGKNVLEKVAFLFNKEFEKNINCKVDIKKNIKIGGGMGGGSSNAGYFLHFLLKENDIYLNQNAFCKLAMKVGADVPFFHSDRPKICTGYGNKVTEVKFALPKNLFVIVYIPNCSVNTKDAFNNLNPKNFNPNSSFDNFDDILQSKNTFETIANTEILDTIKCLKELEGFVKVGLSGSGSACFALFDDKMLYQKSLTLSKKYEDRFKIISSKIIL